MNKFQPFNFRQSDLGTPFGIFQLAISQYLGGRLALLQPVKIISTDGTFATVRPMLAHYDTTGNPIEITAADDIPNVPIVQPFGANGQFQFKPEPGDQGLLIACNWDTTRYKTAHDTTTVASNRQFNWSDGFFIPVDFRAAPTGALIKNGNSSIGLEKDEINLETGTFNANAETNITGNTTITGNVTINGNITVTGTVSGAGVTDTTTSVTLGTHTHGIPPSTPPPTPGT